MYSSLQPANYTLRLSFSLTDVPSEPLPCTSGDCLPQARGAVPVMLYLCSALAGIGPAVVVPPRPPLGCLWLPWRRLAHPSRAAPEHPTLPPRHSSPQVSVPNGDSVTITYSGPSTPGNTVSLMYCFSNSSAVDRPWRKANPTISVSSAGGG